MIFFFEKYLSNKGAKLIVKEAKKSAYENILI